MGQLPRNACPSCKSVVTTPPCASGRRPRSTCSWRCCAGGPTVDFVLVCPPAGLSTAEVFRGVTGPERPLDGAGARAAAEGGDVEALGRALFNRLQPAAERLCPAVAELVGRLAGLGPAGWL